MTEAKDLRVTPTFHVTSLCLFSVFLLKIIVDCCHLFVLVTLCGNRICPAELLKEFVSTSAKLSLSANKFESSSDGEMTDRLASDLLKPK